jgi:hypothetical protein
MHRIQAVFRPNATEVREIAVRKGSDIVSGNGTSNASSEGEDITSGTGRKLNLLCGIVEKEK